MLCVPVFGKCYTARQKLLRQRQDAVVGVGFLKTVAVVALGLQLLAVQLREAVNVIDIVKAVTGGLVGKSLRKPRLQPCRLLRQQAEQAKRNAPLMGVLTQKGEQRLTVAALRHQIGIPRAKTA